MNNMKWNWIKKMGAALLFLVILLVTLRVGLVKNLLIDDSE